MKSLGAALALTFLFGQTISTTGFTMGMPGQADVRITNHSKNLQDQHWLNQYVKESPFQSCQQFDNDSDEKCEKGFFSYYKNPKDPVNEQAANMFLIQLQANVLNHVDKKIEDADRRLNCVLKIRNNVVTSMDKSANRLLKSKIGPNHAKKCDVNDMTDYAQFHHDTIENIKNLRDFSIMSETEVNPDNFYDTQGNLRLDAIRPKEAKLPGVDVDFANFEGITRKEFFNESFKEWDRIAEEIMNEKSQKEIDQINKREKNIYINKHAIGSDGIANYYAYSPNPQATSISLQDSFMLAEQLSDKVSEKAFFIAGALRNAKQSYKVKKMKILFENTHLLELNQGSLRYSDEITYSDMGEILAKSLVKMKKARQQLESPDRLISLMSNVGAVNEMLQTSDNLERDCEMANQLYARNIGYRKGDEHMKTWGLMALNMGLGGMLSPAAATLSGILIDSTLIAQDVFKGLDAENLMSAFDGQDAYAHYEDATKHYESAISNGITAAFSLGVGKHLKKKLVNGIENKVNEFADSARTYNVGNLSDSKNYSRMINGKEILISDLDIAKINAVQINKGLGGLRKALTKGKIKIEDLPPDFAKALGIAGHDFDPKAFTRVVDAVSAYQGRAKTQAMAKAATLSHDELIQLTGLSGKGYSKEFFDQFPDLHHFGGSSDELAKLIGTKGNPVENLAKYTSKSTKVVDSMMGLKTQLSRGLSDHTSREYLAVQFARQFADSKVGDAIKSPVKRSTEIIELDDFSDAADAAYRTSNK